MIQYYNGACYVNVNVNLNRRVNTVSIEYECNTEEKCGGNLKLVFVYKLLLVVISY